MRVINFAAEPPGGSVLARFDAEITPEIRLCRMILRRNAAGELKTSPASSGGQRTAQVATAVMQEISKLAIAAYSSDQEADAPHATRN